MVSGGAEPEHSREDPAQHEGRPAVCSAELPEPHPELLQRVQPQVQSHIRDGQLSLCIITCREVTLMCLQGSGDGGRGSS